MKPLTSPTTRHYSIHEESFRGRRLCIVEQASSLLEAAEIAAVMLGRAEVRPVAALIDESKGVFIAFGTWKRHNNRRDVVKEIRFAVVLEKEK